MSTALFINGIYNGVLTAIIDAQNERGGGISFLQPYKGEVIRMLKRILPTQESPIRLYISTTEHLSLICYTAEIIGWEDKRELSDQRVREVYEYLEKYQPDEAGYFKNFNINEKKATNLITIHNLKSLDSHFSTSLLRKVSDGEPLKKRTRAGGWSEVYDIGDLIDLPIQTAEQYEADLLTGVSKVSVISDEALYEHLKSALKKPEKVQVVSIGYRRNADVIVAVLRRAQGFCEKCRKTAPFLRKSDNSPYLEIHHKVPLSQGGEDTIENAMALCPNCHRELHHGMITDRKLDD